MAGREHSNALKERMAYEAARIMVEQGLSDFDRARRKAAARTGILDRRHWPSNEAVQEAISTQRRLFRAHRQGSRHPDLRHAALQAMRLFQAFEPRIAGSALEGLMDPALGLELFLFADQPEEVLFELMDLRIPWRDGQRLMRYPDGQASAHPVFRFLAGDTAVALIVLPRGALRNPPLDPVTERPLRGIRLEELERLADAGDPAQRREIGM